MDRLALRRAHRLALGGHLRHRTHRRRPERFFFFRGPGGGALVACAPFVADAVSGFAGFPVFTDFAGFFALPSPVAGAAATAPAGTGSGAGKKRLIASCWPIVQKLVVIQ